MVTHHHEASMTSLTSAFTSNKRPRIESPPPPPPRDLDINDLPDEALAVVAQFLTKSSRALFAVAITAPSSSWRRGSESDVDDDVDVVIDQCTTIEKREDFAKPSSPACQAILSLNPDLNENLNDDTNNNWSTLDFAELEPNLARRLTDDDLHAILTCIDASKNLQVLKMTNCSNITGRGLIPLRGSRVVKQIDLSLVGKYDNPAFKICQPADVDDDDDDDDATTNNDTMRPLADSTNRNNKLPRITEHEVLPILDSIIDATPRAALEQLTLPKSFRNGASPTSLVEDFIFKYDSHLEVLGGPCTKCKCNSRQQHHREGNVEEEEEEHECSVWGNENINGNPWFIDDEESQFYACQNFTCYVCLGHYCLGGCVGHCSECERSYCIDCNPILACDGCSKEKCRECWKTKSCGCVVESVVTEEERVTVEG
eukprot:CAMPEP_0201668130 /NCGR_PEP_ID=MMETSP0494-20130426/18124_1 /ASSEMBLY_ACC=CAM_ASM_000839 /TAXON_ID=420259 /ORGANISM="Thalassiosira gravida, Strain GMp14c1" /LENGTH=427 /DNA_ID=CAMNT_0048148377 /DNA_START=125 /DNA_END=1408 /DNA_ORIENTATION=-